jgi:hypothetical protein
VSLVPIDLQTLFSQSNTVGKEQAVQKEATPTAQSLQGSQLVQKTEQRDNDVNETPTQEEGSEKVKDRARRGAERRRRQAAPRRPAGTEPPAKDVVRDPELGRNVDISG